MIVHIPPSVVRSAIADMRDNPDVEVIGFFGMDTEVDIAWFLAKNVSPEPSKFAEVDARWIADLVINKSIYPIAMMHSHPSGKGMPSEDDIKFFPKDYVDVAFIWTPSTLSQYTANGDVHDVHPAEVIVHATR